MSLIARAKQQLATTAEKYDATTEQTSASFVCVSRPTISEVFLASAGSLCHVVSCFDESSRAKQLANIAPACEQFRLVASLLGSHLQVLIGLELA